MIYFIGGMKHREFKYFELIEKIRKSNQGITESFFDVDIKEEDKFLEKISFNSIFSTNELIVLKRAEKLKDLEKILDYMGTLDINNKEIIIDYFKEVWGIDFYCFKEGRQLDSYSLCCGTKNGIKFIDIIKEYVQQVPSMLYKIEYDLT